MKRQIAFAILLFSSLGALAQKTQEDLNKEIKPLIEKVKTLQSENTRLKSEIATLDLKLAIVNKSIDSLRNQTKENSSAISQTEKKLENKIKEIGDLFCC